MCPNSCTSKQQGFLLPLAIFIVVAMAALALVLTRNIIQTNFSATQEMVSAQTFYAAESGAQRGMQIIFYPDASSRQAADIRCIAMNTTIAFGATVTGLKNCSTVVTCGCLYQDNSACAPGTASNYSASTTKPNSFYKISSVATCGSGNLRSVRTIEAGSFLEQE